MPRRHVVITGTGRSGTSFLVELLTHLGFDTGYQIDTLGNHKCERSRAGLETDIRKPGAPYIVKNPWFCDYATEVVDRADICIDHVFVPMRDLKAAADSRRTVTTQALNQMSFLERFQFRLRSAPVTGGLTTSDERQELKLLSQIYELMLTLSRTMIPLTLMQYPRLVQDPAYLYCKLQPILGNITFSQFEDAFRKVARQELVHSYNEKDR